MLLVLLMAPGAARADGPAAPSAAPNSAEPASFDEEAPSVDALQQLTVTDALPSAES